MNRIDLATLLLTATIGTFVIFGSAVAGAEIDSMKSKVNQQTTHMIDASYRVANHSKSIVIESLSLAKHSITLALDLAIDSL